MHHLKETKFCYLAGLLFGLAAIVYFFAANWAIMGRSEKVGLAVLFMLLFYLAGYGFTKWKPHLQEVGAWIFWGGSIVFGIAVALLGQIYNSHADSYTLFLVWLIPSVLFAIFTRYPVFFVQSYILFNISIYTYFFPLNSWRNYSDTEGTLILAGMLLINLLFLYAFLNRGPRLIAYLAIAWVQILLIRLTTMWTFIFLYSDEVHFSMIGVLAYLFVALITGWLIYDFLNNHHNKVIMVMTAIGTALNLIVQFLLVVSWIDGTLAYIFGVIIAIVIIIVSSSWLRKLGQNSSDKSGREGTLQAVIKIFAIFLAVILLSSSYSGIVFLVTGDFTQVKWITFLMIVLVPLGVHISKANPILRYTLILTGILISSITLWGLTWIPVLIYTVIMAYAMWMEKTRLDYPVILGAFIYGLVQLVTTVWPDLSGDFVLIGLLVLLFALYYVLQRPFPKAWTLIAIMTGWLVLSFFSNDHPLLYYIYNLSYLGFLIYSSLRVAKNKAHRLEYAVYLYLVAYLGYKYYDLFWKLLHKSVTFAILGIVFIAIALYLDRRKETAVEEGHSFVSDGLKKWLPIVVIQIFILLVIIFQKESILRNGTDIVLKVEPVDPRSILQGDYVQLSYNISESKSLKDNSNQVFVLLEKNEKGIYEVAAIYDDKQEAKQHLKKDQVLITGKTYGETITYGIEHFFVEEGKGEEVEADAKYAKVRVGANGDAILLELTSKEPHS